MAGGVSSVEVVKDGATGLEKLVLREAHGCSVQVFLYGGQVIFWENEYREQLLFVSRKAYFKPPKAIRGGIQICFPQFGNHGVLEQHGFARNRLWSVDETPPPFPATTSNCHIDLILKQSPEDLKIWPNSEVRVEGLETLDYIDNLQCGKRCTEQGDAVVFESEAEKVYLSAPPKIVIIDHDKKRTFELRKEGLPDVVVWNPWDRKAKTILDFGEEEYKCMLCVGAANAEKPITLRPGEEWQGRQEISVVPSNSEGIKNAWPVAPIAI
uniref:glucose-6-phosphate 1-epimerase n=1 Tax=Oryza nivara TaxID=4536 RepID=A0A0E0G272_ORYNI